MSKERRATETTGASSRSSGWNFERPCRLHLTMVHPEAKKHRTTVTYCQLLAIPRFNEARRIGYAMKVYRKVNKTALLFKCKQDPLQSWYRSVAVVPRWTSTQQLSRSTSMGPASMIVLTEVKSETPHGIDDCKGDRPSTIELLAVMEHKGRS